MITGACFIELTHIHSMNSIQHNEYKVLNVINKRK